MPDRSDQRRSRTTATGRVAEIKSGDEFKRFESLTKRLLAVPKKEINGQGERQKAKKKAG